jgi:hypothetical protein
MRLTMNCVRAPDFPGGNQAGVGRAEAITASP